MTNYDMHQAIKDLTDNKKFKDYLNIMPEKGLVMEFGVSSGGTYREICAATDRPVFGFDSWEGLPEDWLDHENNSRHKKEDFQSGAPRDLPKNSILVNGWFEDSVPKFISIINEPVAFMHIDCDLYSSTKTIFNNFKNRFQPGSIIIFDELIGYDGWEKHEYKAFHELLEDINYKWECVGRHGSFQFGMRIFP